MGKVIKLNMDTRILAGEFQDGSEFLVDEFEDAVRPIVTYFHTGTEVDTKDMTLRDVYKVAVSIVKKRKDYTPVQQKKSQSSCQQQSQSPEQGQVCLR